MACQAEIAAQLYCLTSNQARPSASRLNVLQPFFRTCLWWPLGERWRWDSTGEEEKRQEMDVVVTVPIP